MNNKSKTIISSILFTVAAFYALFSIWALINSIQYISSGVAQGQIVFKGSEYDIINFFVGSVMIYIFYAAVLLGLGWLVKNNGQQKTNTVVKTTVIEEVVEEAPVAETVKKATKKQKPVAAKVAEKPAKVVAEKPAKVVAETAEKTVTKAATKPATEKTTKPKQTKSKK